MQMKQVGTFQVIEERTIEQAAKMLLEAAPGSRVILFGSHATGRAGPDSDLDFLVVEPEVRDRMAEMVRLRRVLRPLGIPVDVAVVSAKVFEEWRDTPNTILYEAAREGRNYEPVS
jgi:predicted nucleotidyltransferase